jgi:hypothetical protein
LGKNAEKIKINFVTYFIRIIRKSIFQTNLETMKKWLKENGYDKVHDDGKVQKFAIFVNTIDDVVSLFKEFMS